MRQAAPPHRPDQEAPGLGLHSMISTEFSREDGEMRVSLEKPGRRVVQLRLDDHIGRDPVVNVGHAVAADSLRRAERAAAIDDPGGMLSHPRRPCRHAGRDRVFGNG